MAVIRNPTDLNDPINYVATIAFFCCVSCVVLMLRFKFKAKLNIAESVNYGEVATDNITIGGYRFQKDEYFGLSGYSDTSIKVTTPVAKLPQKNNNNPALRPAKSTNDLNKTDFRPVTSSKSTSDISLDPRGNNDISNNVPLRNPDKTAKDLKKEEKERKQLEKKQIAEQKAKQKAHRERAKRRAKKAQDLAKIEAKKAQDQAKIEAKKAQDQAKIEAKKAQDHAKVEAKKTQDHAKIEAKNTQSQANIEAKNTQDHAKIEAKKAQDQEKIEAKKAKDRAKIEAENAKNQAKIKAKEDIRKPPIASARDPTLIAPSPSTAPNRIEVVQTISIHNDINRNSGPPPYSEMPASTTNETKKVNRNTSFSKPIESSSSWDMISQHRQQISRPSVNVGASSRKQMVMDLQYRPGNESDPDNSEA